MQRWTVTAWSWIGQNHEQLKILFVVIAGLYVIFEYRTKLDEGRIARAVEEVSKYDSYKSSGATARLDAFWLSDKVKALRDEMKTQPAEKRPDLFHNRFAGLVQSEKLTPDVHQTLTHYRKVAICVRAGLCDADTICRFMFDDIQGFRETYRGLLEGEFLNEGRGDAAYLAEKDCTKQFREYCQRVSNSSYCRRA
jgi:hypothetical protein